MNAGVSITSEQAGSCFRIVFSSAIFFFSTSTVNCRSASGLLWFFAHLQILRGACIRAVEMVLDTSSFEFLQVAQRSRYDIQVTGLLRVQYPGD